jgi:hypothetical protein
MAAPAHVDPAVTMLTGAFLMVVIGAVIMALVGSLVLLWLYGRSLRRLMREAGGRGVAVQPLPASPARASPTHQLPAVPVKALNERRFRLANVYSLAGLVTAVVVAIIVLRTSNIAILPIRFTMVLTVLCWPAVLVVVRTVALTDGQVAKIVAAYFGTLLCLGLLIQLFDIGDVRDPLWTWLGMNTIPTAAFLVTQHRRIRAIGPILFALAGVSLLGASVAFNLMASFSKVLEALVNELHAARPLFYFIIAAGFVCGCGGAVVIAVCMRWLYANKRISEHMLEIFSTWFMFVLSWAVAQSYSGGVSALLWAMSGFPVFVFVALLAMRRPEGGPSASLLLLRVFVGDTDSRQLWDALGKTWRHLGPVHMIAGPDLSSTSIEPHEFFDYVLGRLRARFVATQADLSRAEAMLDSVPDPDGRYRANDLFCFDDTWRAAFLTLLSGVDVILMDLRGLSPERKGTLFELEQVAVKVPAHKLVTLVNSTTHLGLVHATIAHARASRGLSTDYPLQVVEMPRPTEGSVDTLLQLLARAACADSPPQELAYGRGSARTGVLDRFVARGVGTVLSCIFVTFLLGTCTRDEQPVAPTPPPPLPVRPPVPASPAHAEEPKTVEVAPAPSPRPRRNVRPRARKVVVNGQRLTLVELSQMDALNCGQTVPDGSYFLNVPMGVWSRPGLGAWMPLPSCAVTSTTTIMTSPNQPYVSNPSESAQQPATSKPQGECDGYDYYEDKMACLARGLGLSL